MGASGAQVAALIAALAIAGCEEGCGSPASTCDVAGGNVLPVGALCVRVVEVRALRDDGALEPVPVVDALVHEASADGAEATIHLDVPGPARAVSVVLEGLPFDTLVQNGWQSWSFAGEVALPALIPTADDGLPDFVEARTGDPVHVEYGISYASALLGSAAGEGPALVAGALTAHDAVTGFGATAIGDDAARLEVVYGAARELLPMDSDGVTHTEPLWLRVTDDAGDGLARLGDAMEAAARARPEVTDRPRTPSRPPGGWYSWNEHLEDIDQELIRAHIAAVRDTLLPAGMPLLEIDDGWSRAWGDWEPNERFPDGMEAMAAEIDAAGLVAGIWMAPFFVEERSEAAAALPEAAFVHTASGERLLHELFGNPRRLFVVDPTSVEGRAHLEASLAPLVSAGFRFFKLDFLYAASLPGVRHADVTGTRALREGMKVIREIVGDEAIINGCGTPIAPVLGLVDSLRVGADITFGAVSYTFIAFAARDVAARRFAFPLAWPDADQALLREPRTIDEARVGAAFVALAGPAYSIGDDLLLLDDARLALGLAPELLALAASDTPAVPVFFSGDPGTTSTDVYGNPALEALANDGAFDGAPPALWRATTASGDARAVRFDWGARRVDGL